MNSARVLPTCVSIEDLPGTIERLLREAQQDIEQQQSQDSEPFLKILTVAVVDSRQSLSCYSREISRAGIGLLHCKPLPLGDVVITIFSQTMGAIHLSGRIEWCRPCGEGWYISGARFDAERLDREPE